MSLLSSAVAEYAGRRKKTLREVFLQEMELAMPWKLEQFEFGADRAADFLACVASNSWQTLGKAALCQLFFRSGSPWHSA